MAPDECSLYQTEYLASRSTTNETAAARFLQVSALDLSQSTGQSLSEQYTDILPTTVMHAHMQNRYRPNNILYSPAAVCRNAILHTITARVVWTYQPTRHDEKKTTIETNGISITHLTSFQVSAVLRAARIALTHSAIADITPPALPD